MLKLSELKNEYWKPLQMKKKNYQKSPIQKILVDEQMIIGKDHASVTTCTTLFHSTVAMQLHKYGSLPARGYSIMHVFLLLHFRDN